MKKLLLILVALCFAVVAPTALFADFDKKVVDDAMHINLATMGTVKKALDAKDFWASAQAFYTFASTMQPLLKQSPPKGNKADWDALIGGFVDSALKGVGACGEKNLDKANAALKELQVAMGKGHSTFR